jgi:hypothetical protein
MPHSQLQKKFLFEAANITIILENVRIDINLSVKFYIFLLYHVYLKNVVQLILTVEMEFI